MTPASLGAVVGYARRLAEPPSHTLTDRQLLDRFTRERSDGAFAELVRRHGPMVLATCRRVLRHEHDAEDVFQAAFLVLARKAASIQQGESVAGWLFRVAYRLAVRAQIAVRRRRECELADELPPPNLAPSPEPLAAAVAEELHRLPEQYRSVVVLCYLEGRTQPEAARLLATTATAVNGRLKRARELLRKRLARRGLGLCVAAGLEAFAVGVGRAAVTSEVAQQTAQAACRFATNPAASGVSTVAAALANGAINNMTPTKTKLVFALLLSTFLLGTGALLFPVTAQDDRSRPERRTADQPAARPEAPPHPHRSVILVWLDGGPSQLDLFDPKPDHPNGSLTAATDTNVPGVQISQNLPRLAKLMDRLLIVRSLTHREGDHARGAHLMRTGYAVEAGQDLPALPCVLAKELSPAGSDLPPYVRIGGRPGLGGRGFGPGLLGPQFGPVTVTGLRLPPAEDFDALAKGRSEKMRDAVTRAFDLDAEPGAVRDGYGKATFGPSCLLARRLVQAGVAVVEVTLAGWDVHARAQATLPRLTGELDAGLGTLIKDLLDRKMFDRTLIVVMGEFGRTPRVNQAGGRDHWPFGFSVVLAGAGIQGGKVIGKTSADGGTVVDRPVTPPELLATIYQAVGVDHTKANRPADGEPVPLVPRDNKPIKEALR